MSVAFTKEGDSEAAAADLPDRPVSQHTNYVTVAGLAQIDAALALARADYSAAQAAGGIGSDRTAMARASRDLRYWTARRATAQLVESGPSDTVRFGSRVMFERDDGRRTSYAIVGEDEADPANGSVSHVSPVARALIGKMLGDVAMLAGSEIEIVGITQAAPAPQ